MSKFRSGNKNLLNTLSIKSEIEIKEEPLEESHEEYLSENDTKFESENLLIEASEICSDDLHLDKPCGSNLANIEVKHEDTFVEVHSGIIEDDDFDVKADVDVKTEDIEDLIEDKRSNLSNVIFKRNIVEAKSRNSNEPKRTHSFNSPSPISSRFGNGKRNIIELKNEERKKDGNKLDAKFECFLCEYKTNLNKSMKRHSLVHSTVKLLKCSECDYECNHKSSLKVHLLSHSNTKLFKCSKCDYECNRKHQLKTHLLTHSNTKLFKCSECDYECNQNGDLKIHILSHSNTKLFKCSECDYGCNEKRSLKIHILSHSNTKLFQCSKCDYECNVKRSLKRHLLSHSIYF